MGKRKTQYLDQLYNELLLDPENAERYVKFEDDFTRIIKVPRKTKAMKKELAAFLDSVIKKETARLDKEEKMLLEIERVMGMIGLEIRRRRVANNFRRTKRFEAAEKYRDALLKEAGMA